MADQPSPTAEGYRDIVALDRLIHEPARMVIMAVLYAADADFLYLERETGLTKGNLSSHLSKLEQAGYLSIDKTFVGKIPRTVCRLTDAGRQAFRTYRASLSRAINSLPGA
jgi:DNA-binding MarR family transcriptional regulator